MASGNHTGHCSSKEMLIQIHTHTHTHTLIAKPITTKCRASKITFRTQDEPLNSFEIKIRKVKHQKFYIWLGFEGKQ